MLKNENLYPAREKPPQLYSAFASSGIPSLKKGGECVTYLTKFPVIFKELVQLKLFADCDRNSNDHGLTFKPTTSFTFYFQMHMFRKRDACSLKDEADAYDQ